MYENRIKKKSNETNTVGKGTVFEKILGNNACDVVSITIEQSTPATETVSRKKEKRNDYNNVESRIHAITEQSENNRLVRSLKGVT